MSSIEYAELFGLKTALSNLQANPTESPPAVVSWLQNRIKELTSK